MKLLNKNLLRGVLASKGMTQDELAKHLKISANTLSSRMTGASSFTLDEIDKICEVLEITNNSDKANIFLACSSQIWDKEEVSN